MIRLEYEIKTGADPANPNEQLPGVELWDDRLFGLEKVTMIIGNACYNREVFSKPKDSNKLTFTATGMEFYNGQIVTLDASN